MLFFPVNEIGQPVISDLLLGHIFILAGVGARGASVINST